MIRLVAGLPHDGRRLAASPAIAAWRTEGTSRSYRTPPTRARASRDSTLAMAVPSVRRFFHRAARLYGGRLFFLPLLFCRLPHTFPTTAETRTALRRPSL